MRKLIYVIVVSLLIMETPALAANLPISGKSCPKPGAVQNYKNLKFTCIKSGKKFVWNKGVPLPLQGANPPSDTQQTPQTSSTLQRLENVWNDVRQLRSAKPIPAVALDIRFSPNVNKPYAEKTLNGLIGAAQFWQQQFLPTTPMPVLVFTENDRNWLKIQLEELQIDSDFIEKKLNQFDAQAARTNTLMNWAGMNGASGKTWFEFSIGTDFGTSKTFPNSKAFELGNLRVGPHEYTHAVQFKVIDGPNMDFTPCWFIEGGAEFYGLILGSKDLSTLKQMRQQQVWEPYYINFKGMAYEPSQGWENFLDENGEFSADSKLSKECGPNGAYPVGSVATQYLYELKGQDGIVAFMQEIGATKDWKKALLNVYGATWTKIRGDIASYIRLIAAETTPPAK